MITTDLIQKIKDNLKITDDSKDLIISDVILEALNYCNLEELPAGLEPYIRKKVQGIINYEAENGTGSVFDVASIREGDTTTTYNVSKDFSRETIYGLSDRDKTTLREFRRLRK